MFLNAHLVLSSRKPIKRNQYQVSLLVNVVLTYNEQRVKGWCLKHESKFRKLTDQGISIFNVFPGEGNGNPFQYSCRDNSMNRGDLPDPGVKSWSPALQVDSLAFEPLGKYSILKGTWQHVLLSTETSHGVKELS